MTFILLQLRSQVQVLKKGVVDEQQKNESLKTTITTQDQSIRKLEQELDSVKFRNRQLEKRIEILQECDSTSAPKQQPSFDANLLLHVEQNKQLQESLATLNEKYTTEVSRLKRMIDHEMVPRDLLDSLKSENADRLSLLNKKLQEFSAQNAELRDKLDRHEMDMAQRANESKNVLCSEEAGTNDIRERLVESEQAREKLNSEVQILRLKLKRLSVNDVASPEGSSVTSPVEEKVNMLGRLQVIDDDNDRDLVITYLKERNNELVKLMQNADSKAVYYYYESLNLCRLVRTGHLSYKRLDAEFDKLKVKYRGLCDAHEDTIRNYNTQVDSLTEHIALLNEKLVKLMDK